MFWLLIAIFFVADGSKHVETVVVPTQALCQHTVAKYVRDFKSHIGAEILGIGFKCDGPFDDPTVRKDKT